MEEPETEKLIELIRSKPGLYDKSLKDYRDRILNKTLWREVCEEMFDTWNVMPIQEKKLKAKEIQQRWQNLRTCFKRELNKMKSVALSKKRRKYIHYNQLSFLLTTMYKEDKGKPSGREADNISPSVSESKVAKKMVETTNSHRPLNTVDTDSLSYADKEPPVCNNMLRVDHLKVYKDDIDEDKSFLLSLVPSFRKMTDDQKLEAKIEFLSIIKRISRSNSGYANADPANCSVGRFSSNSRRHIAHTLGSDPAMHSDISQSSFLSSCNTNQPSEFIDVCEVKVEEEM